MISSSDFRPGISIEYKDGIWTIVESMHIKPGKGSAFVQTKLKNVTTGDVLRVNFRAGERVRQATLEKLDLLYSYREGETYFCFVALEHEFLELSGSLFGQNLDLLKEGQEGITALRHNHKIIQLELPIVVELSVKDTPGDERGDTTSGSKKLATMETGATIAVPFHVKAGDVVRIDTRSRAYLSRC